MHTQGRWKWHPKFVAGDHNGSIYAEPRQGHAYAIAMQPRYVADEQWRDDASIIVRAVNAHDALVAALECTLSWLTSYPGGGALGAYEQARAALHLAKHGSSQVEQAQ